MWTVLVTYRKPSILAAGTALDVSMKNAPGWMDGEATLGYSRNTKNIMDSTGHTPIRRKLLRQDAAYIARNKNLSGGWREYKAFPSHPEI